MLPALSRVICRNHVASDGAISTLLKSGPLLVPLSGQTTDHAFDENEYLVGNLVDSDGDEDDDEVDKRFVCPLMPHHRRIQEEHSDESRTEASSAIQVLDISVSISAASALIVPEAEDHTFRESEDKLRVITYAPAIDVPTAIPSVDHDPSRHCSYRKGKCTQPRTVKRNGSLHTLCAFHREKSCVNQKAFDGKKRSVPATESVAKKTEKQLQKTANRVKKKHNKAKKKGRTQSKKASAQGKPAAPQRTVKRQRKTEPAPDRTDSSMTNAAKLVKPRQGEGLECSKEQPLHMDDEGQDERDFFAEFTRVLDGRQLSKAKQLALTQFLRDVLL